MSRITRPLSLALVGAVALAAGAAQAQYTHTQSVQYDWDAMDLWQITTFDAFDDNAGLHVLTGVSFSIDATAQWEVTAANYTTVPFSAGEWFADGSTTFNVLFGDFGAGAEYFVGAIGFEGVTGDLGAGDGNPIFGTPGDPVVPVSVTGTFNANIQLAEQEFAFFTADPIETLLLSWSDITVDGPDGPPGIINFDFDMLISSGELTLTYHYAIIPAPASGALLALGALAGARRRRRA